MPKVITKNSYRYWGLAESLITTLIPIFYLFFNYKLYKIGGDKGVKFTIWAWIVIIIVLGFIKNFVTKFILDLRENQSDFAKRGTRIVVLSLVILFLTFSYLWIKDLMVLLLVYVISLILSLYPYYKYTKNKAYYDKLKGISEDENLKGEINQGNIVIK